MLIGHDLKYRIIDLEMYNKIKGKSLVKISPVLGAARKLLNFCGIKYITKREANIILNNKYEPAEGVGVVEGVSAEANIEAHYSIYTEIVPTASGKTTVWCRANSDYLCGVVAIAVKDGTGSAILKRAKAEDHMCDLGKKGEELENLVSAADLRSSIVINLKKEVNIYIYI